MAHLNNEDTAVYFTLTFKPVQCPSCGYYMMERDYPFNFEKCHRCGYYNEPAAIIKSKKRKIY